ncbi:MAG: hypothetical protein IKN62_00515 [Elusimicrobia bacterium]|nr:hypothetical protein [Elusimicrobiota bacterium]
MRNKFEEKVRNISAYDVFTVDSQLQKKVIDDLVLFLKTIKTEKNKAKQKQDEKTANNLFYMQCFINAIRCSLKMWIYLKEQKYVDAWHSLVDAQEYMYYSLKAGKDIEKSKLYLYKLKEREQVIFPKFKFVSSGSIIEGGKCSICGRDFNNCEHIEENLYCGSICKRIDYKRLEFTHLALVENPKDRGCIIEEFELDKKIYDWFTLKFKRNTNNIKEMEIKVCAYRVQQLDIF